MPRETPKQDDLDLKNYAEAAARLNVKVGWLQDRVQAREVPCRRLGRQVRFTEDDIQAIIAQARQPVVGERTPRRRKRATTVPEKQPDGGSRTP
jgi:excisionase family DNA binding protein